MKRLNPGIFLRFESQGHQGSSTFRVDPHRKRIFGARWQASIVVIPQSPVGALMASLRLARLHAGPWCVATYFLDDCDRAAERRQFNGSGFAWINVDLTVVWLWVVSRAARRRRRMVF